MGMPSFTSGLQAALAPCLQPRMDHRSGLCRKILSAWQSSVLSYNISHHTLDRIILMRQRIPSSAELIHSLLVRPGIAWLVLGSCPTVAAAGVCLHGHIASAGVGQCLDYLVLICAVRKRAVRAFAVRIGQVGARGCGGHGG